MESRLNGKMKITISAMISILLMAIVISFIPFSDVKAADEDVVQVYFEGDGLLPAAGNTITHKGFKVKAQNGGDAHCKIVDPLHGFTDGVQWTNSTKEIFKEGDKFEKAQYFINFSVRPDSGYRIDKSKKNSFKLKIRGNYLTSTDILYDKDFDCYIICFSGGPYLYAQDGWSELNLSVDTPIAGKQVYDKFSSATTKPTGIYSKNYLDSEVFKYLCWSESKNGKDGWRSMQKDESFKKGYYYRFVGVNASSLLPSLQADFYTFGGSDDPHDISQSFKVSLNGVDNTGFNTQIWSNKGYIDFGQCREEVDTIEINLTMPKAGVSPIWNGTIKSDKYSLVGYSGEYVRWYDENSDKYMKYGDKFVPSHKYRAEFEVQPGSFTRWAPTTSLIVNGVKASSVSSSISAESKKTSPIKFEVYANCSTMDSISLYGMGKFPVIGDRADSTDEKELIIDDPLLKITRTFSWCIKKEDGTYEAVNYSDKFKEGVTYYLPIKLSFNSDPNVVFPTLVQNNDINIEVAGADKAFIYESKDPYNEITIYAEFTPLKPVQNIDIFGYKIPAVEDKTDYESPEAKSSSHCVIDTDYNTQWFKKGVAWGETFNGSQSLFDKGEDTEFVEGHEYVIQLLVKPAKGYGIPLNISNIKASIGGYDAEVGSSKVPGRLLLTLKRKTVGKITRVDFTVEKPVAGQPMNNISFTTVPENAFKNPEFYNEYKDNLWSVSETNEADSFKQVGKGAVYEAGKYYAFYPIIMLMAASVKDPGEVLDDAVVSGFSKNMQVYVNGELYNIGEGYATGLVTGDITQADITGISDKEYTGSAITQAVKVTFSGKELSEGKDYQIEYTNNVEVGTATVKVNGMGYYEGSKSITFAITAKPEDKKPEPTATPAATSTPSVTTTPVQISKPVQTPEIKPGESVSGIGKLSEDGKTIVDESGDKYNVADKLTEKELKQGINAADQKSGGKYKITKVKVKGGKVTGGEVEYITPYYSNYSEITVPDSVTIAGKTFKVTSISSDFSKNGRNITKVVIGKNVTKIGKNAFKGCSQLKNVIFKTTKLKKVGKNAFKTIKTGATFKCPKKKLNSYKKLLKKSGVPKKAKFKK